MTEQDAAAQVDETRAALEACRAWCKESHVPDNAWEVRAGFMAGYASKARDSANPRCDLVHRAEATMTESVQLNEARASFVYEAARLAAQAVGAPIIPVPWSEREEPFRVQFRDVIERQCGEQRSQSPEELHGSWTQAYYTMGWVFGPVYDRDARTHPDLVPYANLGQLERDKDAVFVALCDIARQWIYQVPVMTNSRLDEELLAALESQP